MLLLKAIYSRLSGDVNLAGKVFMNRAPQTQVMPFAVALIIGTPLTSETKSAVSQLDGYTVQVSCFATTYSSADSLASNIKTRLDGFSGTESSIQIDWISWKDRNDLFEDRSGSDGVHHIAQDFLVIVHK